jgi:hypothetical protein
MNWPKATRTTHKIIQIARLARRQIWRAMFPLLVGLIIATMPIIIRAIIEHRTIGGHFPWSCFDGQSRLEILATCFRFPGDTWHQVTFVALYVSVLSAFVLYFKFPAMYRLLRLGKSMHATLNSVIPTMQAMLIFAAAISNDDSDLHTIFVVLYLTLFVFWDGLIIHAPPNANNRQRAHDFKLEVRGFLLVDLPAPVAFAFLYCIFHDQKDFSVFAAGVVAVQATSAFLYAIRFYYEEQIKPLGRQLYKLSLRTFLLFENNTASHHHTS